MGTDRWSIAGLIENALARSVLGRRHESAPREDVSGSFLLGRQLKGRGEEPVVLSDSDRSKHIYILGSTGAGKSNLLVRLVEHDYLCGNTAVVIDLRGDLVDRLIIRLAEQDDLHARLRLVDLRQEDWVFPFNPLSGLGSPESRALHTLGVIKKESESWGIQLEETLRYCLLALCEGDGTLLDLEPLLTDARYRASVLNEVQEPYVRSFFDRYGGMSAERQMSWSLPVLNKVSAFYTVPVVRQMLGTRQRTDWSDWIDTPGRLVCVALAGHRLQGAAQLVGSLLVSSLQSAIMARADVPEQDRHRLTMYIDEFETMATPAFNTLIAEGRRFQTTLTLAHQHMAQVEASLRHAIRGNVQTQVIFQCGNADATELAGDVIGVESREQIRRTLLRQRVGEALLIRRGQNALHVATVFSPDPKLEAGRLAGLRNSLLESTCRPVACPRRPLDRAAVEVRHVRRPRI